MKTSLLTLSFLLGLSTTQAATWGDLLFPADTLIPIDTVAQASPHDPARGLVATPFLLGKCEVTAAQWVQFLNSTHAVNPVLAASCWHREMAAANVVNPGMAPNITFSAETGYSVPPATAQRPVTLVSRENIESFLDFLATDVDTGIKGTRRYRLPTENEWYAAAFFDPATSIWAETLVSADEAFFTTGQTAALRAVGLASNARGISDMGGNAAEWTATTDGQWSIALGGTANAASGTYTGATARGGLFSEKAFASYIGFRVAREAFSTPLPEISGEMGTTPAIPVDGEPVTFTAPVSGASTYYWYLNGTLIAVTETPELAYPAGFSFSDIGAVLQVIAVGADGSVSMSWELTAVEPNLTAERLTWLPGGVWEIGGTTLWQTTSGTKTFAQQDRVTFSPGMGGIDITLASEGLSPADILVETDADDTTTFTGTGSLAGTIPVIKKGEGTLAIAVSNPLLDTDVQIQGGTLELAASSALGTTTREAAPGSVTVYEGAEVVFRQPDATAGAVHTYRVSGSGSDGKGALHSVAAAGLGLAPGVGSLILEGDTTLGAYKEPESADVNAGNWQLGRVTTGNQPGITGNGNALTIKGDARIINNGGFTGLSSVNIESGELRAVASATFDIGEVNIASGATLSLDNSRAEFSETFKLHGGTLTADGNFNLEAPLVITENSSMKGGTIRPRGGLVIPEGKTLTHTGGTLYLFNQNPDFNGKLIVSSGTFGIGSVTESFPTEAVIELNGVNMGCALGVDLNIGASITGTDGTIDVTNTSKTIRFPSINLETTDSDNQNKAALRISSTAPGTTLLVEPGDSIKLAAIYLGQANSATGQIIQNGGTIELTGAAQTTSNVGGNLRISHWQATTSYTLNDGELKLTNPNGCIDICVDGVGTLTVNGGVIRTPQLEINSRSTTGAGNLLVDGGALYIGAKGLTHSYASNHATATESCVFRSGTFIADAQNVPVTAAVDFDGDFTFNTPEDTAVHVTKAASGSGGFTKAGSGLLAFEAGAVVEGNVIVTEGVIGFTCSDNAIAPISAGNITFGEGVTIQVNGLEDADGMQSFPLFIIPDGGTMTGLPNFTSPEDSWRLVRNGNILELRPRRGTRMILH